jgi:hypothetical protein
VKATGRGNNNIARLNSVGLALACQLVLPLPGKNRPAVLAIGMNVGLDALAWLDMPGNKGGVFGFTDHRADGFPIGGLHELIAPEDPLLSHKEVAKEPMGPF